MKLKYITFVFENCDSITIEGKYIGDFIVDNIQTSIRRIACNTIRRIDTANVFAIEIHKDANKERYQHNQTNLEEFKQMTFDRFTTWQDITYIEFELEDDLHEEGNQTQLHAYSLDWFGPDDTNNLSQKTYISKLGHLYIVVADNKRLCDFFDGGEIDNEENMTFHMKAYGIEDTKEEILMKKTTASDQDGCSATPVEQNIQDIIDINKKLVEANKKLETVLNTAILDIQKALETDDICSFCAHEIKCPGNKTCSGYISGKGMEDEQGKKHNWKWNCTDFDFGTCDRLKETPCGTCDFKNNFKWKGERELEALSRNRE